MAASSSIDFSSLFGDIDSSKSAAARTSADPQQTPAPKQLIAAVDHAIDADVEALYVRACACVCGLRSSTAVTRERFDDAKAIADATLTVSEKGTQALFDAVFAKDRKEDPLVANNVNVMVIAAEPAKMLYADRERVLFVMTAALLHDIGMDGNVSRLRVLGDAYADRLAEVAEQEYERLGGASYPRGMSSLDVAEAAQIVGLCNTYEGLTHARTQHDAISSVGALKSILSGDVLFSSRIVKAFIACVGLYPKGTYVELNTKEIARVQQQHPLMPASPVVEVVVNAKGEKAAERRIIDLSRGTRIYIVRPV
jgi:HD-GYP domain-containing protein (c-di-GMP phosphodiesterase class II)